MVRVTVTVSQKVTCWQRDN